MNRTDADIFVSGGGIAGLTTALSLADAGLGVVLADPAPPAQAPSEDEADLRTTAYLQPARALFEDVGIWEALAPFSTPLEALRVVDSAGAPPEITDARIFRADEVSDAPFGWNVPNWRARAALAKRAEERLDIRLGVGFKSLLMRDSEAIITLTDGAQVRCRMAVGADGARSPLRQAAGIEVKTVRYGQTALVSAFTHPAPHENISTEIYLSGGAFTLVPMHDRDRMPASALVWMNDGPEARRLAAFDSAAFSEAATRRSCGIQGPLTEIGRRQSFPILSQRATALTAPRVVLLAEAAHVMPPIGAQGLNTSLSDIRALRDLVLERPEELGTAPFLARYAKRREADTRARIAAIDVFNRVCRSANPGIQALRGLGLRVAHDLPVIRRRLMRAGLGG